jgi:hypothetical protein
VMCLQQSLYRTSMPGAGAVHHIKSRRHGLEPRLPLYP